jgi:hypothetical protein
MLDSSGDSGDPNEQRWVMGSAGPLRFPEHDQGVVARKEGPPEGSPVNSSSRPTPLHHRHIVRRGAVPQAPGLRDGRSLRWWLFPNWCRGWMPSWCVWATRPRRWSGIGAAGDDWRAFSHPTACRKFSLDVAMAWVDQACDGFFDKEQTLGVSTTSSSRGTFTPKQSPMPGTQRQKPPSEDRGLQARREQTQELQEESPQPAKPTSPSPGSPQAASAWWPTADGSP